MRKSEKLEGLIKEIESGVARWNQKGQQLKKLLEGVTVEENEYEAAGWVYRKKDKDMYYTEDNYINFVELVHASADIHGDVLIFVSHDELSRVSSGIKEAYAYLHIPLLEPETVANISVRQAHKEYKIYLRQLKHATAGIRARAVFISNKVMSNILWSRSGVHQRKDVTDFLIRTLPTRLVPKAVPLSTHPRAPAKLIDITSATAREEMIRKLVEA